LKVLSVEFVTSASASGKGIPGDGLPQVALAGRSNVGKSSLLNALTRRRLARTSAAPGKTRLVNVYRVELEGAAGPGRTALYLIDLPGYGYARGGSDAAAELKAVAEAYLVGARGSALGARKSVRDAEGPAPTAPRRHVLLLVDSRHPGLDADRQAAAWLDSLGVDTRVVATKIDKLTRPERARNLTALGNMFGTAAMPVSATSGEGLDELWRMIARIARDADRGRDEA
jgi:GTP-binding protein